MVGSEQELRICNFEQATILFSLSRTKHKGCTISRGGFKGEQPLLFLQRQRCAPFILAETGYLTMCGCRGIATFLLKKCLRPPLLKIPGAALD